MMRKSTLLLLGFGVLAACDDPGPLEQAGEEVDEAIEDARNSGETLDNRVDDAADELREAARDSEDELNR
jgi:hypothetical protein